MNRPNPTTGLDHRGPDDSADFPRLMSTVGVVVAAGCAAAWWPVVELVMTTGLLAAPLAAAALWALRREVRICRRLATPTTPTRTPVRALDEFTPAGTTTSEDW